MVNRVLEMWVLVGTSPIDRVMGVTPIADANRFRFARQPPMGEGLTRLNQQLRLRSRHPPMKEKIPTTTAVTTPAHRACPARPLVMRYQESDVSHVRGVMR